MSGHIVGGASPAHTPDASGLEVANAARADIGTFTLIQFLILFFSFLFSFFYFMNKIYLLSEKKTKKKKSK
jgi:hypothetical protein